MFTAKFILILLSILTLKQMKADKIKQTAMLPQFWEALNARETEYIVFYMNTKCEVNFLYFFIISAAFYESFCLSYLVHTILGKKIHFVRKNVKFGWRGSLVISFLPDITLWQCQWLSKNTQNQILNVFSLLQFHWTSLLCSKYFVRDCILPPSSPCLIF